MLVVRVPGVRDLESFDPVLQRIQTDDLILGIRPEEILNGIAAGLRNVDEQETA